MSCRKVRDAIPLLAGGDLSPRRARRAERHCADCPACRRELAAIRAARDRVRAAADAGGPVDLRPAEWAALLARVRAERPVPEPAAARPLRPRLAGAIALAAAAGAAALLIRGLTVLPSGPAATVAPLTVRADEISLRVMARPRVLMPGTEREPAPPPRTVTAARREVPPPGPQTVISVTLIAEESGLQVNWVFNRDFDWKGDRK